MSVSFVYGKQQGVVMNQKQIQARALDYIQNRVALTQAELAAHDDKGMPDAEATTFIGWFATYDDFKEWVLTDSDWSREECAHLREIHRVIGKLMHC
jgi:hypothetical protein